MPKPVKKQLIEVFSQPTAPYREGWVQEYVKKELQRMRIPQFQDRWGNIFAGVDSPRALKNSQKTALVAHTDHPGFHIIKKLSSKTFQAQWHGGHPPKMKNSALAIYDPAHRDLKSKAKVLSQPDKKGFFKIKILKETFKITKTSFGAFDYPGYKFKKTIVETRVADDLTGVVIILATLARLSKIQRKNFLGIFTTAEETGFKGTLGLLKDKTLGLKNKAISLEASRQMTDAWIGKGPVIRLGDRKSIFDNFISFKLDAAALALTKSKKLKFQKRVMNGGTCEATAFNLFGIQSGGLAIPLGNYHNQKQNGTPGPEFVDLKDVETAVDLCVRFYQNESKRVDPALKFSKLLMKNFEKTKKLYDHRFHR